MITSLSSEIQDPKYHSSLTIRAGRLKGEKRDDFITCIANENILLAIQCAVECEENPDFEQKLIQKAEIFAKNFNNSIESERGFLALAKINANEKILEIFKSIQRPNKIHKQVIESLIHNNEPTQALDFILLLLSLPSDKSAILNWALTSFDTKRLPDYYDKSRKMVSNILNQVSTTTTRVNLALALITKYNLENPFTIVNIIQKLIEKEKSSFLKIALKIIQENQLEHQFPIQNIIQKLIQNEDTHSIKIALKIIQENQLEHQFPIQNIIQKLIQNKDTHSLMSALTIIQENQLESQFPIQNIIQKLIQNKGTPSLEIALKIIQENQLEHQFLVQNIIQKLIEQGNNRAWKFAEKKIKYYQLENQFIPQLIEIGSQKSLQLASELKDRVIKPKKISKHLNQVVECIVKILSPFGVKVDIPILNQEGNIFIKELTDKTNQNIQNIKYKDKNLHIGQKITAKIIDIDNEGIINLSLNQIC
jgi:hypothetical protein